ncbi:MAG: hypothetical protein ACO36I_25845, partial [Candidatus Latescibacterota bacterium]
MIYIRWMILLPYFLLATAPLFWLGITSFKTNEAAIASTASFIPHTEPSTPSHRIQFHPTLDAYRNLATPQTGRAYSFFHYLSNSILIGLISTFASVALGTGCAYGFSRFQILGAKDWLFFILSTRFLPPLAV